MTRLCGILVEYWLCHVQIGTALQGLVDKLPHHDTTKRLQHAEYHNADSSQATQPAITRVRPEMSTIILRYLYAINADDQGSRRKDKAPGTGDPGLCQGLGSQGSAHLGFQ